MAVKLQIFMTVKLRIFMTVKRQLPVRSVYVSEEAMAVGQSGLGSQSGYDGLLIILFLIACYATVATTPRCVSWLAGWSVAFLLFRRFLAF